MADSASNPETPTPRPPRPPRPVFMGLRVGCSDAAIDLSIEFSVFHGLKAGPVQIDLDDDSTVDSIETISSTIAVEINTTEATSPQTTSPMRQATSPIRPPIYACDEGSLMKEPTTFAYDEGSLMEESLIDAFEEGSLMEQTQEPISRYGSYRAF